MIAIEFRRRTADGWTPWQPHVDPAIPVPLALRAYERHRDWNEDSGTVPWNGGEWGWRVRQQEDDRQLP